MTDAGQADAMLRLTFGPNSGLAFSPDGTLLAAGSAHPVEIIDAADGQVLRLIRGHAGTVADVAFSPDGTQIATGSGDGTARIWDAVTGTTLVIFSGHLNSVQDVAFSPDGARLATASTHSARVWDAADGPATRAATSGGPTGCTDWDPTRPAAASPASSDSPARRRFCPGPAGSAISPKRPD